VLAQRRALGLLPERTDLSHQTDCMLDLRGSICERLVS
jgi:hypothetical protein